MTTTQTRRTSKWNFVEEALRYKTQTRSPTTQSAERPPVLTKPDFVRRYKVGEFGNRAPTWNTIEDVFKDGYRGLVHIRNKRQAGGRGWYNIDPIGLAYNCEKIAEEFGLEQDDFYFSGMAPHQHNAVQGEIRRAEWVDKPIRGLELLYSTRPDLPMRDALALDAAENTVGRASGIVADTLLRHYLCGNSYEWLQELLNNYPDHCVEFSTFWIEWGTIPNFNTVFWEVRAY